MIYRLSLFALEKKFRELLQETGTESFGIRPEITSPQRGITYQIRLPHLHNDGAAAPSSAVAWNTDEPIPFRAVADADVKRLFWFVDESLSGTTAPNEDFFWKSRPGSYVVRVVDDRGEPMRARWWC